MTKKLLLFFIVFLFSTFSYAKESVVGNYSRTPNGETVIKISKTNGVYYIEMSTNTFKNIPGIKNKPPTKEKWSKKEKGKKAAISHLHHLLGENWNTKVKWGLHFNKNLGILLRLHDSYILDNNFSTSTKDIYSKHPELNASSKKSKYVFSFMYWYFDVYKQ